MSDDFVATLRTLGAGPNVSPHRDPGNARRRGGQAFSGWRVPCADRPRGPCTGRVEACEPPQRLLLTMRDPRSSTRPAGEDGDRSPADRRGRSDQAGTSSIWPTTSAVGSSATSRPAGVSSSQLTKHRTSAHPSSRRASQSTNRVGRRRLPADPRRDWGRR
jgi:hypothetical protein